MSAHWFRQDRHGSFRGRTPANQGHMGIKNKQSGDEKHVDKTRPTDQARIGYRRKDSNKRIAITANTVN